MGYIGPGSRVKCIKRGEWKLDSGRDRGSGCPSFGTTWTVEEVYFAINGETYLRLFEWPTLSFFHISRFSPLYGDKELEKLREIASSPERIMEPA